MHSMSINLNLELKVQFKLVLKFEAIINDGLDVL